MNSLLASAKTGGTHGLRGEVKVFPFNEDPGYLFSLQSCVICTPDGKERKVEIENVRQGSGYLLFKFQGYDNPEKARALSGSLLKIDRSQAAPLEEGEFYVADFYGLEVVSEGIKAGVVESVSEGAQALFLNVRTDKGERLIPYLPVFLSPPDFNAGTIELLMPSLLD